MIEGTCHCGAVGWTFEGTPESALICNCTICRRYGVLWAYGFVDENIKISGPTQIYRRADAMLGFHFCATCGCVAYWRSLKPDAEGRSRIAVNLRLAEPSDVENLALRRFDGLNSFQALETDERQAKHLLS